MADPKTANTNADAAISNSARAAEDGRLEEGRKSSRFHYPVMRHHTGLVQFRVDGAEVMDSDRFKVRRGEVIAVKKAAYADSLVATGHFAHAPEGTPVGQPLEYAKRRGPMTADEVAQSVPPSATITPTDPGQVMDAAIDRVEKSNTTGATPAPEDMATLLTAASAGEESGSTHDHLETFDGTPASTKKSPK